MISLLLGEPDEVLREPGIAQYVERASATILVSTVLSPIVLSVLMVLYAGIRPG